MRAYPNLGLAAVVLLGCVTEAAAQKTATERLDALLKSWRGQSVAHLREVWGREQSTEMNRDKVVLVYEKRPKISATLGGIAVTPTGGSRCAVRFEIDADEVLRTAHRGTGDDCWRVWRGLDP